MREDDYENGNNIEVADIRSAKNGHFERNHMGHAMHGRISGDRPQRDNNLHEINARVHSRISNIGKRTKFPVRWIIVFCTSAFFIILSVWGVRSAVERKKIVELPVAVREKSVNESVNVDIRGLFGALHFLIEQGGGVYANVKEVALKAVRVAEVGEQLLYDAPLLMLDGEGDILGKRAVELRDFVGDLLGASTEFFSEKTPNGPLSFLGEYLSVDVPLRELADMLDAFAVWLRDESPHHLIVLLENPSEIRPSGGFVGSFIHVVVMKGNITDITVHDINEVDRTYRARIIPPEPLRLIAERWTIADTNWFFDFPQSAEKILGFMEDADFYREKKIRFESAVAITGRMIQDVMAVTGPIALSNGVTITDENVILSLQDEVQAMRSEGDDSPKKILSEFTELLVERMRALTEEKRRELFSHASEWMAEKDVMIYTRNNLFRDTFRKYGFDGAQYKTKPLFVGDYLAVVVGNVGGSKTDLFMEQKVVFESRIDADGTVEDKLSVTRTHNGSGAAQWWYRALNQVYVMAHTLRGARVTGASGISEKQIPLTQGYLREGYTQDPDVVALENDSKVSLVSPMVRILNGGDKTIFGAWVKTERGAKSVFSLEYARTLPLPPKDGMGYTFVLETQAGIPATRSQKNPYEIILRTPLGFVWGESGLSEYVWKSDDPPGRTIFSLTFKEL